MVVKSILLALLVALVASVPVEQVPTEAKVEETDPINAPEPAAEPAAPTAAAEPAEPPAAPIAAAEPAEPAAPTGAVEPAAPTGAAEPAPAAEEPKAATEEDKVKEEEPAVKSEEEAKVEEAAAKAEEPAAASTEVTAEPAKAEETKDQALKEVMGFLQSMGAPLTTADHDALSHLLSSGGDIMAEAEKKARKIEEQLDAQALLEKDSLFGVKADGTVDAKVATDQITSLISAVGGPSFSITDKEKNVMAGVIDAIAKAFAPTPETNALAADFERVTDHLAQGVAMLDDKMAGKDRLDAQTLISLSTEAGSTVGLTNEVLGLGQRFFSHLQKTYDEVTDKLADLEEDEEE